jgi:penicillin G amidase
MQKPALNIMLSMARQFLMLWLSLCLAAQFVARLQAQTPRAAQQSESALHLAGLREPVQISLDERAIPHIEAASLPDLYFAQGYYTASDRLWQMDLQRRTARGQLSEILGPATLEDDKRQRLYDFSGLAEAMLAQSDPQMRAALEAYARGVNAFIDSRNEQNLPLEFKLLRYRPRPWTPADSIIMGKLLDQALSTSWPTDIFRASLSDLPAERRAALLPETSPLDVVMIGSDSPRVKKMKAQSLHAAPYAPDKSGTFDAQDNLESIMQVAQRTLERVGLYAEQLAASNNWVVNGAHSVTGKPLLANDPHLQSSAPSIWYLTQLSAPGLRVAGVTLPGVPGIVIGHNEQIAWGITNLRSDSQDLYAEKFDKENPRRYQTPAGWRDALVRHEEIKVRKSFTETATETVPLDVTVTRHGPIILEKGPARYALRWSALDAHGGGEFESFLALNRAHNWNEFRLAVSRFNGPAQNFVYADVRGHIGYYGAGRVPLRSSGDGSVPYDGALDDGEWKGYIPFAALPHLYDPPAGIILTANNRIVGSDYPYYLTHEWTDPYRARRIYNLLHAKEKFSVSDFEQIQGDNYSFPHAIFAAEVVKVARPLADNLPAWREMLAAFDGWNGRLEMDSRAAPLASAMRTAFQRHILEGALGVERARQYRWFDGGSFIDRVVAERPALWLPKEYDSYQALLLACYQEARADLTKRLGEDQSQWKWGRAGQIRFPHPLAGVPGVGAPFSIAPLEQNTGGNFTVNAGAAVSMRFIADTSDWDNTRQGLALGQSGDPNSPHWKDQLEEWRAVKPGLFLFTRSGVTKGTKQIITLTPGVR